VLIEQLRALEEHGMVSRQSSAGHGQGIEYRLTPLGESLRPILESVIEWGAHHARELDEVDRLLPCDAVVRDRTTWRPEGPAAALNVRSWQSGRKICRAKTILDAPHGFRSHDRWTSTARGQGLAAWIDTQNGSFIIFSDEKDGDRRRVAEHVDMSAVDAELAKMRR
jgi:HxlR-like helix-turn-helix